ncbi:unnamed protein product [Closterium sp. NIES-53]
MRPAGLPSRPVYDPCGPLVSCHEFPSTAAATLAKRSRAKALVPPLVTTPRPARRSPHAIPPTPAAFASAVRGDVAGLYPQEPAADLFSPLSPRSAYRCGGGGGEVRVWRWRVPWHLLLLPAAGSPPEVPTCAVLLLVAATTPAHSPTCRRLHSPLLHLPWLRLLQLHLPSLQLLPADGLPPEVLSRTVLLLVAATAPALSPTYSRLHPPLLHLPWLRLLQLHLPSLQLLPAAGLPPEVLSHTLLLLVAATAPALSPTYRRLHPPLLRLSWLMFTAVSTASSAALSLRSSGFCLLLATGSYAGVLNKIFIHVISNCL